MRSYKAVIYLKNNWQDAIRRYEFYAADIFKAEQKVQSLIDPETEAYSLTELLN